MTVALVLLVPLRCSCVGKYILLAHFGFLFPLFPVQAVAISKPLKVLADVHLRAVMQMTRPGQSRKAGPVPALNSSKGSQSVSRQWVI